LTVKCLELLQKDAGDAGVMQASTEMKKQALDRSKIISGRLKALAITVGLLIVFCPTIISCGHKTNPVNDAAEFRPDIPFKNANEKKPDYLIIPGDGATKTTNTPEADKGFNGNEEK
jgi:hypothetical protein